MAATMDYDLFCLIESTSDLECDLDKIIIGGLKLKKAVVEKDPHEKNLRKVLNFGHTIGHAIESVSDFGLLHGECVGLGMLPMAENGVRARLEKVLKKYNLPTKIEISSDKASFITGQVFGVNGGYII
jgi:3-dehydroquinate synthase